MKRPIGLILLTLGFCALSLNALAQVALVLAGRNAEPMSLVLLQLASGVSAAVVAVGAWKRATWSPLASVVFGVVTAGMLVALPFILSLDDEARFGIFSGAALVLLFSVAAGWYLHREHGARTG